MEKSLVLDARDLTIAQKQAVESLLGFAISDGERLGIRVTNAELIKPAAPSERRAAIVDRIQKRAEQISLRSGNSFDEDLLAEALAATKSQRTNEQNNEQE
jgi:hypothetical protein